MVKKLKKEPCAVCGQMTYADTAFVTCNKCKGRLVQPIVDGIIAVVVIKNDVVDSRKLFDNAKDAENEFKKLAQDNDSAWADLSKKDISGVLDNGYWELAHDGSICIVWPELVAPRLAASWKQSLPRKPRS